MTGYICPQYSQGIISSCSACDVFSFGVLLCELITGKTLSRKTHHYSTYKIIKRGRLEDDADECVDWGSGSRLKRLSMLALECMNYEAASRPSIGELVDELRSILHINKHIRMEENPTKASNEHRYLKCRTCGLESDQSKCIHCFGTVQHIHCHECFENHLKKNINNFRFDLTCPKEGCSSRAFDDTEIIDRVSPNVWSLYLVQRSNSTLRMMISQNQSLQQSLQSNDSRDFVSLQNSLASMEKRLFSKVETECQQMKDLQVQVCAGNGLPCPRLFVLLEADRQGKPIWRNPREWVKNLKSVKLYIYFECSYSYERVSDNSRIKVRYTPDWLQKIAPALNASLTLIQLSLKAYSGVSLPLNLAEIQELDEWVKELIDPDDKIAIEHAQQSGDDNAVKELVGRSLSFVAEKAASNWTWQNEMVAVYDHVKKVPTFVLSEYASLSRYGGMTGIEL